MEKNKNASAENNSHTQSSTPGGVNPDDYAGNIEDEKIAKQHADQYINDVNQSMDTPDNKDNAVRHSESSE